MRTFLPNLKAYLSKITALAITTPQAIIIGALILGISHVGYAFILDGTDKQVTLFQGRAIDQADFVEGSEKEKIYVVEYSDPECPYCVSAFPTLKQLRSSYGDKVAFVYRHYPLTQIHPNAFDESKAIACAGKIGGAPGFYRYSDALYGYKSSNKTTQLPLNGKEDLAKGAGLDLQAFTSCMNDPSTNTIVDASLNDGLAAGVQGTPTTFILKKTRKGLEIVAMVDGARPYEYFQAAVEQALAQ